MWPFQPRKPGIAPEPPPPPPVYERECKCGHKLFSLSYGILESEGRIHFPLLRFRCVRCGNRISERDWADKTRRAE